jgi:hypothetical protein
MLHREGGTFSFTSLAARGEEEGGIYQYLPQSSIFINPVFAILFLFFSLLRGLLYTAGNYRPEITGDRDNATSPHPLSS